MITLLAMQAAISLSSADENAFEDYRECAIEHVRAGDLAQQDAQVVSTAKGACDALQLAAGMDLAADDAVTLAEGRKPKADVDARMRVLETQLTDEMLRVLADRRVKGR